MTMRNKVLASLGAIVVALLIAVVAVSAGGAGGASAAQGATSSQATPGTSGTPRARHAETKCAGDFGAKLAANLGISQDELEAAIKKTALQEIDEAEAEGRLTADQAQRARDRVNNSEGFPCFHGAAIHGRGGMRGAPHAGAFAIDAYADTVANFFGITTDQLKQDLKEQGSLQGIAAKYGKDNPDGKAALKAAIEQALRHNLTDRGVSADQVDQIVSEFSLRFDQLYTMPIGRFGPARPGDGPKHHPRSAPTTNSTSTQ